jgi:hypothetical protein
MSDTQRQREKLIRQFAQALRDLAPSARVLVLEALPDPFHGWTGGVELTDYGIAQLREFLAPTYRVVKVDEDETPKEVAALQLDLAQARDTIESLSSILDDIWGLLYPKKPDGWEYPGQVVGHIHAELRTLRERFEGQADKLARVRAAARDAAAGRLSGGDAILALSGIAEMEIDGDE